MINPLMSLLRASMQFGDSLNNVGFRETVQVHMSREDGLRLLKLVTHCNSTMIEQHAQGKFTTENGSNCLKLAGLSFSWPVGEVGLEASSSSEGLHARDITPYAKQLN